jgi:type I restriction-modification system DNA methylase subunit
VILTQETKDLITKEFEAFQKEMYAGRTQEERSKLGQFFTPAALSIQMIERFKVESLAGQKILDPTCGSGNLLAACLIAGADSDKVFGNELDKTMLNACRRRLNKICRELGKPEIPYHHLHQGDATNPKCLTTFSSAYKWKSKEEQTEVDKIEDALDASLDLFMKNFG